MRTKAVATGFLACVMAAARAGAAARDLHVIQVVDDATGRGVPLVELKTTGKIRYYTDSNGVVAFDEPGLLDRQVFFTVSSHGYEYPADGFGIRGVRVQTKVGGKTVVKIHRVNVAERLYRITGQGIYADTVKAGDVAGVKAPIEHPVLNADVCGQDSVQMFRWGDKLYWFFGDTDRVTYPLGQFGMSGATSVPPEKGGLDPSVGVNLTYWVDKEGFSRPTAGGTKATGATWLDGMMILNDPQGHERVVASYAVVKSLSETLERGLMVWDGASEKFKPLVVDRDMEEVLRPCGQPLRVKDGGGDWYYFPRPYPLVRVRADWNAVQDRSQYESFTCLAPGRPYTKGSDPPLDRDPSGKLRWGWKKHAWPLLEQDQEDLIKAGKMKPDEAWYRARDEKGARVVMHSGTVCWNEHRKKWVMVGLQMFGGPSPLGEVWYAEAKDPWGPFDRAVKVVTHDRQTFYNVVQHPDFDQQGGRLIYFEGTYTNTFSGNPDVTPRYDYNQVMYRLDLADPRLKFAQQQ